MSTCLQGLKASQGERDELNQAKADRLQVPTYQEYNIKVTLASFSSVQMLLCHIRSLCKAVHTCCKCI